MDTMGLHGLNSVQLQRWEGLASRGIVQTHFFDVPTLQALELFDCTQSLFENGGLGEFLEKSALTYPRYLLEFLSTLEQENESITCRLNDVERALSFEELRVIFGVSKIPTEGWQVVGTRHFDFWHDITDQIFN